MGTPSRAIKGLALAAVIAGCSPTQGREAASPAATALQRCFDERRGCTAVYEATRGWLRNDEVACRTPRLPCSTFKIPNTLIGLEQGVVVGPDTVLDWDRERYPEADWWPKEWSAKNDLRAAFAASVVPYYRHMATLIGRPAMERWLDRFGYGSRPIGGQLDSFWLESDFAISADEQVQFLQRFTAGKLGVSAKSQAVLEDIMIVARDGDGTLRAKTGMGDLPTGGKIGWYVGYVTRADSRWYFATNVIADSFDDVRTARVDISRTVLRALGAFGYAEPGCDG